MGLFDGLKKAQEKQKEYDENKRKNKEAIYHSWKEKVEQYTDKLVTQGFSLEKARAKALARYPEP